MVSYVVIGTSRGIGLAWVHYLASDANNTVFAVVRNKGTAQQLLDFVNSEENKHKNVTVLEADLTDYKTIKAAAESVSKATGGSLDILICNGAIMHHERSMLSLDAFPDEETLENDLLLFFKTNVIGVTHTINAFLPLLRAGKTKKILVVSTAMGSTRYVQEFNLPWAPAYAITKAALNMAVMKFALKLKDEDFTFVAVSPGIVNTSPDNREENEKWLNEMVVEARKVNPHHPGVVSAEQSVREQLAMLNRMSPADSGAFVFTNGTDANVIGPSPM